MLIKAKKYITVLTSIDWVQTLYLYLRIRKPRSSSIRVLNKSHIFIHKSARIIMGERSFLEINHQDYLLDKGSDCRIELDENATLHICGNVSLHRNSVLHLHQGANLTIGSNTYLNGTIVDCCGTITIGGDCAIAGGVKILDNTWHEFSNGKQSCLPVTIGNSVWIATVAIILPGVRLGDGCVVGAGAVVTHDVPDNCLVAGVPAKIIRRNVSWTH